MVISFFLIFKGLDEGFIVLTYSHNLQEIVLPIFELVIQFPSEKKKRR